MKQEKTLSQICKERNISRKVVQGYEKHGLIRSCGKNELGRLIYDKEAETMIMRIRFYQYLGFTLKEIKELMDTKQKDLKAALEKRQKQLDREIRRLEERKAMAKRMYDECFSKGQTPTNQFIMSILKEENR